MSYYWLSLHQVDEVSRRVAVTYLYWGDAFDEWLPFGSPRLAPERSQVYVSGGELKLNHRIEVRDTMGQWIEAEVIAVYPQAVRVHYHNWHAKWDEDVARDDADRIRPYGRSKSLKKTRMPIPRSRIASVRPQRAERARTMAANSQPFIAYEQALLHTYQLRVQPVDGDGNCMFRSVSHQVYGDERHHMLVRQKCMDYMEIEREYFAHFVEGDMNDFLQYLAHKRQSGVWGDDPEIQALCELYDRPAEIWVYDQRRGARVLRTFHEAQGSIGGGGGGGGGGMDPQVAQAAQQQLGRASMRLSYYGGGHYDSVVGANHEAHLIRTAPGVEEERRLELVRQRVAAGGFEESKQQSDVHATEQAQLAMALQASRNTFDNLDVDLDRIFASQTEMALAAADNDQMDQDMLRQAEENELQQVLSMSASATVDNGDSMLEHALAASVNETSSAASSSSSSSALSHSDPELAHVLEMSAAAADGDPELNHALELSKGSGAMTDDEAQFRLALALSAQQGGAHMGGAAAVSLRSLVVSCTHNHNLSLYTGSNFHDEYYLGS